MIDENQAPAFVRMHLFGGNHWGLPVPSMDVKSVKAHKAARRLDALAATIEVRRPIDAKLVHFLKDAAAQMRAEAVCEDQSLGVHTGKTGKAAA